MRSLRAVRNTIRERRGADNVELSASFKQAASKGLGTVVGQMFTSQFTKESECTICLINFEKGNKLIKLPCFDTHIFHQECMEEYVKAEKAKNLALTCPICRKEFKEEE